MALRIYAVVNGRTASEEFVWLNTDEEVNLFPYAVVDRTFLPNGEVSNEFRHIFVFPNLKIGKGDYVSLCTGKGKYEKVSLAASPGCYIHKLYWGAGECVWNNNGGDTASLIKYVMASSVKVPAVK